MVERRGDGFGGWRDERQTSSSRSPLWSSSLVVSPVTRKRVILDILPSGS
jgi:hypothetical protein